MSNNLINIKNYPVPHGTGKGTGGVYNTYVTYNGTQRSTSEKNLNNSFLNIDGDNAQFQYILANEGQILKLQGNELNYNYGYIGELESDSIKAGKVDTDELNAVKGFIENLDSKNIVTEYLTVTKQAHFFELIIDKVRAVGGQIILSPAQCIIDKVYAYDANGTLVSDPISNYNSVKYFDVYWRKYDGEGRATKNEWVVNDQALCQSFNVDAGTHYDIANKYYWRLVKQVFSNTKMINFETNEIKNVGDSLTSTNNISISMKPSSFKGNSNLTTWAASAQTLPGVQTGVTWVNGGTTQTYVVTGTMKTSSTVFGIQILPTGDYTTFPSDKLSFHIYNTDGNKSQPNINIGVYFSSGYSEYFPNVQVDNNFDVDLNLNNDNDYIEAIVINCSQPVQWQECYGMRLGNDNSNDRNEVDQIVSARGAVPEKDDSLVQLGYRGVDSDSDYKRQSAIIIAAYKTPDADLTAPSYAQYMGINDFHLREHRGSYIDANGAQFLGDITLAKVVKDAQGNVTTMSELVVDVNGIATHVETVDRDFTNFTTVTYATFVTQTNDAINLRATQTYVDGDFKTEVEGMINTSADNITLSVQQNYYNKNQINNNYYSKSSIDIKLDNITSSVQNCYTKEESNTKFIDTTEIQQTANSITSSVKSWCINTDSGFLASTEFKQTANSISLSVVEPIADNLSNDIDNVKSGLIRTGIDITNQKIALNANSLEVKGVSGDAVAFEVKNSNNQQIAVIQGKEGWGRIHIAGPTTGYQSWITLEPQSTNCLFNIKSGNSGVNINAKGQDGYLDIGLNANNSVRLYLDGTPLYIYSIARINGPSGYYTNSSDSSNVGSYRNAAKVSGYLVADYVGDGKYELYLKDSLTS